jgi:hypothetical protein
MISGLAPGKPAETDTVGKSTWGRGDTGSRRKATAPARNTAMTRSVVAIGRRMKGCEMFMAYSAPQAKSLIMAPFFFTLPRSKTKPVSALTW